MKRGLPDFFTIKSMKRSENKRTNCSNWNPKYISPCIHVIYTMHTLSIMIGYFPSAILGKTPSPTPNQAGIPRIGSTTNWLLPNKLNSKKHSAQMWFISGMKYYYSYAVFRGFFCKYTIWFFFLHGKKTPPLTAEHQPAALARFSTCLIDGDKTIMAEVKSRDKTVEPEQWISSWPLVGNEGINLSMGILGIHSLIPY